VGYKGTFTENLKDQLEQAICKSEFELGFLQDELGKLEDDINKSSGIIYSSAKEGRKDIQNLQAEKQILQQMIKREEGTLQTLQAKLEYLTA
jgi:seryl-tRNA synthetase